VLSFLKYRKHPQTPQGDQTGICQEIHQPGESNVKDESVQKFGDAIEKSVRKKLKLDV